MPSRIFDQETAMGFIKNSFLRFDTVKFQWTVLQDVFKKYSCMGHLQEDDDSDQGFLSRGIDNKTVRR